MTRVPVATATTAPDPFIGMLHLPALHARGDAERALERALADARVLAAAGVDAVVVENYGNKPFGKTVAPHVTAALAVVAHRVREATGLAVGVNALRNDARAALGAAVAADASFIRVNVLAGAMVTDQGVIEGDAAGVAAYRRALRADADVALFADVLSKHAVPFPGVTLEDAAEETWARAGADALLVTGKATGHAADVKDVERVRRVVPDAPVLVASGVTRENARAWRDAGATGIIVGTALKEGGRVSAPVDAARARDLVTAWRV